MKTRIFLVASFLLCSAAQASDYLFDEFSQPIVPLIPSIGFHGGSGGDGGDGGGSGSGGGSGGGDGGGNSAPLFNHDDEEEYWFQLEQEYYDYLDQLDGQCE